MRGGDRVVTYVNGSDDGDSDGSAEVALEDEADVGAELVAEDGSGVGLLPCRATAVPKTSAMSSFSSPKSFAHTSAGMYHESSLPRPNAAGHCSRGTFFTVHSISARAFEGKVRRVRMTPSEFVRTSGRRSC